MHTHTWFGIGSRAGAKPMAAAGSEGREMRVGSRGEGERYFVMKGDAVRKCGKGGCARDAEVGWYIGSCSC